MAKTAYESEQVQLDDGTVVTLKPLTISRMRRFMKEFTKTMGEEVAPENAREEEWDLYIRCSAVALERDLKKKIANQFTDAGEVTEEYREYLEDNIDEETAYRIIKVCGQIDLRDPKLMEAAMAAQMAAMETQAQE